MWASKHHAGPTKVVTIGRSNQSGPQRPDRTALRGPRGFGVENSERHQLYVLQTDGIQQSIEKKRQYFTHELEQPPFLDAINLLPYGHRSIVLRRTCSLYIDHRPAATVDDDDDDIIKKCLQQLGVDSMKKMLASCFVLCMHIVLYMGPKNWRELVPEAAAPAGSTMWRPRR